MDDAVGHFSRVFFFNDTATTEIYTLSLHDALPISYFLPSYLWADFEKVLRDLSRAGFKDRKSTRLNSSHRTISYAVFCLKQNNNVHGAGQDSAAVLALDCAVSDLWGA